MREDPWHEKEEVYLSKIEKQCNSYTNYFTKDYVYYHSLSSRFNIPILVVSSVNALTAISLNDFLGQRYVSILNAVLSAGTGILGSIQLYMKINEKMANALRSQILMKRLALKISKELSIDREQRATEGQVFLQECFGEFNAALEQANPIEKSIINFLSLGKEPPMRKSFSLMDMASAVVAGISPKKQSPAASTMPWDETPQRLSVPRAKTLWGLLDVIEKDGNSFLESPTPPGRSESTPGEESPEEQGSEP